MKIRDIIRELIDKHFKQSLNDRAYKFDADVSRNLSMIDENNLARQFQIKVMANGINVKSVKINDISTYLTKEQAIELTKKFFVTISTEFAQKVERIFEGNGENSSTQKVNLVMDNNCSDSDKSNATSPFSKDEDMNLYVPITGTLIDCYSLIHEITHSFDAVNGDNGTRIVLGEIAPQCMERLFDYFLVNMTEKNLEEYGMDREKVEEDIKIRKISTFKKDIKL